MQYRRVIIPHPGGPEVLKVAEEPVPEPGQYQVGIRVLAAGVARADIMMRRGLHPGSASSYPYTPGYDIVGIVDKLGANASKFKLGEVVAALIEVGGYTEYVCISEEDLVPVPQGLDPAEVVCLVLNHITAYQMLHRMAEVKAGESVLFHAAASGVGTAQLQLGKLAGLTMYGTASKQKHTVLKDLGAVPIDYQREDFVKCIHKLTKGGMEAVFDPVGGSHIWRSFRLLKNSGRLVAYGEMAITGPDKPRKSEVFLHHVLPRWLNYFPGGRKVGWYEVFEEKQDHPDWYHDDLGTLIDLLVQGKIIPIIAERIPLAEARRAHELLEASGVSGKIVLMCSG